MAKYFVITDSGVEQYRSLSKLRRDVDVEKHEMQQYGTDYVCQLTDDSLTISRDIRQLEQVASKKVFTRDKFDLTNWLQFITLIFLFYHMVSGG